MYWKIADAVLCQAVNNANAIGLEDSGHDNMTVITILVWYFYRNIYPCFDKPATDGLSGDERFCQPARIYSFARVYQIPGLQYLARMRFEHAITYEYDDGLVLQCIRLVYEPEPKSDRGLRDLVVSALVPRLSAILEEVGNRNCLKTLFQCHPEFAIDLLATKSSVQLPKVRKSTGKIVAVDMPKALGGYDSPLLPCTSH